MDGKTVGRLMDKYINNWFIMTRTDAGYLYWRCAYCGCSASLDYAETIGLNKLNLADPCKLVSVIEMAGRN